MSGRLTAVVGRWEPSGRWARSSWRATFPRRSRAGLVGVLVLMLAVGGTRPAAAAPARQPGPSPLCEASGWQTVVTGSGAVPIWALAVDAERDVALAGGPQVADDTDYTLYRGTLRSLTWQPVADTRPMPVSSVAMAVGPGRRIWAAGVGANGTAYSSIDEGRSFDVVDADPAFEGALSVVMAGSVDGVAAAITRAVPQLPVVLRWYGGAWTPLGDLSEVLKAGNRLLWAVAMGSDARAWLAPDRRGLWSLDGLAGTWFPVGDTSLAESTVTEITIDPRNPQHLFIGLGPSYTYPDDDLYPRGLRQSVDGGQTWLPATLTGAPAVPAIALNHDGSVVYATAWGDGLWRSTDGGFDFVHLPGPPSPFVRQLELVVPPGSTPASCELLYAGTSGGLYVRNLARGGDHSVYLPAIARDW